MIAAWRLGIRGLGPSSEPGSMGWMDGRGNGVEWGTEQSMRSLRQASCAHPYGQACSSGVCPMFVESTRLLVRPAQLFLVRDASVERGTGNLDLAAALWNPPPPLGLACIDGGRAS